MEALLLNNVLFMEKKTILVTGASSGIGAATSILLSKTHKIILCGRDEERLEYVKSLCHDSGHSLWKYDLSDIDNIESSLSTFIKETNQNIDGFVSCAGLIKYIPVKRFTPSEFCNIYNVNVIAPALVVKVLSSRRYNSNHLKSVVFISSNISNFGAKAHCLYSSSKSALDGLMRSLAMELAPNVRINSILPGAVKTRMTQNIYNDEDLVRKMESTYPLGLGNPEDIANAIKFLISDESRWITGQQIVVDGGRTINLTV